MVLRPFPGWWIYNLSDMKREQLARRLAKESGITQAAAADQLDGVLNDILKRVRHGHSASLPGLGTFWPGPKPEFYFEDGLPAGARRVKAAKRSK
jgi:Bacterial DNA-binding protein